MGKLSLKELLKGVINENDQIKSDDLDKLIDRLEILGKKVESEYVPRSTTSRPKVKQGCKMIGECLPGQMIKTRSDQVQNYAGGFVFRTNDENIVRRFLIIGSTTGTYYVSGHELTLERAEHLCDLIEQGKGPLILRELVDISLAGSAPKQESTLFALALCARYRVCNTKNWIPPPEVSECEVEHNESHEKKSATDYKEDKMDVGDRQNDVSKDVDDIAEKMDKNLDVENKTEEGMNEDISGGSELTDEDLMEAEVIVSPCKKRPKLDAGKIEFTRMREKWFPSEIYLEYQGLLQKVALYAVHKVCRIPTHLFTFLNYCKVIAMRTGSKKHSTGFSRAFRAMIAKWYYDYDPERLVMHITKYGSRSGYCHMDLFRLSHIHPKISFPNEHNYLKRHLEFDYIFKTIADEYRRKKQCKKSKLEDVGSGKSKEAKHKVKNYEKLKTLESRKSAMATKIESSDAIKFLKNSFILKTTEEPKEAAELIKSFGFVHEHVPSHLLNYKEVWTALLKDMPMTAFIRNLGKMTAVGVFDEKDSCALAVSYLTNQEKLRNARIHPLSVLVALSAYAFKSGDCLGKVECIPNEEICSGLSKCFELTFVNVNPTNKRYCVGLDVSGSMYQPASPTSTMNCIEAAVALCYLLLKFEPKVKTMVFASEFEEIFFNSNWTLQEVLGGKYKNLVSIDFGSTDCALPMIWALEKKEEFDVFIVITDNETWAGSVKPCDALCNYRKEMNIPDAKLIVLAMTATNFTIADPNDSNMLDIVGFDPSIHEMISKFVLGEI